MDSNHRSPVKDQLVETVLFDFPAEARKRSIGGRRSQPRDLGGDLRRDHNLRDDNDRLGWGRRQAQNGGSPDGGPMVRILLPPAGSLLRTPIEPGATLGSGSVSTGDPTGDGSAWPHGYANGGPYMCRGGSWITISRGTRSAGFFNLSGS